MVEYYLMNQMTKEPCRCPHKQCTPPPPTVVRPAPNAAEEACTAHHTDVNRDTRLHLGITTKDSNAGHPVELVDKHRANCPPQGKDGARHRGRDLILLLLLLPLFMADDRHTIRARRIDCPGYMHYLGWLGCCMRHLTNVCPPS